MYSSQENTLGDSDSEPGLASTFWVPAHIPFIYDYPSFYQMPQMLRGDNPVR